MPVKYMGILMIIFGIFTRCQSVNAKYYHEKCCSFIEVLLNNLNHVFDLFQLPYVMFLSVDLQLARSTS